MPPLCLCWCPSCTIWYGLTAAYGCPAQAVPVVYTWGTSILLFLVFGVKMAWDASTMAPDEGMEELEEVATEIEESGKASPPRLGPSSCADAVVSG